MRIVQPNIGQQDKWSPGFAARNIARLGALVARRRRPGRGCCSGPRRRSPSRSRTNARLLDYQRRAPRYAAEVGSACSARRPAADRRHHRPLERRRPCDQRHQQRLRDRPGRAHPRPLRQGASRSLWRISADAAVAVGDRPVAARARATSISIPARARARSTCPASARSASSSATRSSSPARWSTARDRPGLHLQSVQRRLVRRLGPAAASRPGAAARARGRAAGGPRDADRHLGRDRRARAGCSSRCPLGAERA